MQHRYLTDPPGESVARAGGSIPAASAATGIETLIPAALATCAKAETRRVYRVALQRFASTGLPLNRDGLARHLQQLRERGLSSASVGVTVAAVRKLAEHALTRGMITADEFEQLLTVGPGRVSESRAGLPLTANQVIRYLALPDPSTYWGKRDACILALMVGCGLRRAEMSGLKWDQVRSREGWLCLVDVVGNGGARTIPVPVWAKVYADTWYAASRQEPPPVPYSLRHMERTRPRDHRYIAGGMRADAVHALVQRYGRQLGYDLTPNDLRRTLARLLRNAGAPLEQIQYTLGHQTMAATLIWLPERS
jgi:integrase